MRPYYLYINLPGEPEPSFLILQPFVPVSGGNSQTRLVSYMVADGDPGNYGAMTTFEMPQDELVFGPVQINNAINTTPAIARDLSLLNQQGSSVIQGSMQLIPVGDSLIYVRPYYVEGTTESAYPQYRFVVVTVPGRDPVRAPTVEAGLKLLFPSLGIDTPTDVGPSEPVPQVDPNDPNAPTTTTPTTPSTTPSTAPANATVQELLARASDIFDQAQTALANRDLALYQSLINQVGDLINQAEQAGGSAPAAAPTTTTTRPPTTSTTRKRGDA
jgi:uncharacterized membrane protein (UPF0182 family)